jgi:CheY-like chemotaxis protein
MEPQTQSQTQKPLKILLVDDDHFILTMYAIKFKSSGFEIETCVDGASAISKLKEGLKPDVILLDMIMPNMDGIETLTEIRKQNLATGTKVVFLSNQNQQSDIDKAKALGVDGYIVKATSIPSEVVDEVKKIIGNK